MWTVIQSFNPVIIILAGIVITFAVILHGIYAHSHRDGPYIMGHSDLELDVLICEQFARWEEYEQMVSVRAGHMSRGEPVPKEVEAIVTKYREERDARQNNG